MLCPMLLIASLSNGKAQKPSQKPDLGPDLFMAVGADDVPRVEALLKRGADPNTRNFLSFTPLIWAAVGGHDAAAKSLLAHGAELEAKSPFGTALTFALEGNHPSTIRFLLARNASLTAPRPDGITPLMLAAKNGDTGIITQLLSKKAPINAQDKEGQTALAYAVRAGQTDAVRTLLGAGASLSLADSRQWTPLTYAIANGHPKIVQMLIDRGADVNLKDRDGRTPLMIAALYGRQPEVVRALMAHRADAGTKDRQGRTALQLAQERNADTCVQVLREGSAVAAFVNAPDAPVTPHAAVTRSLTLLQKTNATFAAKGGCISCHHEGLGLMATAVAQQRGFRIDTALAKETQQRVYAAQTQAFPIVKQALTNPEIAKHLPGIEIQELTPGLSFMLSGLVSHEWPADEKLGALAQTLAQQQQKDGHWGFLLERAPMQSSPFSVTALSVRILKTYMPTDQSAETARRIALAQQWLLRTPAANTEDRTYRLLGLLWADTTPEQRQTATTELRALQNPDGGWAQLATMRSDAYATGQALYALHVAGEVPATDPMWQHGMRFLLQTQDEDGSWYVNKRAIPANNYLDVGFPHGESQYVSYAATCWAMMALAQAEDPARSTARR